MSYNTIDEGDMLLLSDKQTLDDLENLGDKGLQVTVYKKRRFENVGIIWEFYEFSDSELVLIRKSVGDHFEYILCFPAESFTPCSRAEAAEVGSHWVFEQPADVNNYNPNELVYVVEMKADDGPFVRFLEVFGTQDDGVVYCIAEWESKNTACENPRLLALEVGDHIRLFQGIVVLDTEVTLFNRSPANV